jgi:hypothetical protein
MIIMDKFLVVLVGFPLSLLILKYRGILKDLIGNVGFAERYLGSGGTHILIMAIGFGVFIGSLLYATGVLEGFFTETLGSIF